jgi:hypothetical protein
MSEESKTQAIGQSDALTEMSDLLLDQYEEETETDTDDDLTLDDSVDTETEEGNEAEAEESEEEATWASALGIDDDKVVVNEAGNLEGIKVKIDKVEQVVPVAELIAGYQTSKSYTQKTQQLSEQRKEFETARDYTVLEYAKKLDDINKLSGVLEGELVKEYQGINWEALRDANPGEYAAMVQDFQIKQQRITTIRQAIEAERQAELQKNQSVQFQGTRQALEGEMYKILEKNPEWSKPERFKKDVGELKDFVAEAYGFGDGEFNNIMDARIFEVLKDAYAYRKGAQTAQKKMVKTIPKFQKPGAATAKTKLTTLDKLTKAAKSAPPGKQKRDLADNAIAALLLGN